MLNKIEIHLDIDKPPIARIDTTFQPEVGEYINIKKTTYKIIHRSWTVDYSGQPHQEMCCTLIVKKVS